MARVSNGTINLGLMQLVGTSRRSVIEAAGTVYFIGVAPDSSDRGIYRLNGLSAEKVSSPAIDKLCATYGVSDGISGIVGTFPMHGQTHIMFSTYEYDVGNSAPGICYAVQGNYWWQYVDGRGAIIKGIASAAGMMRYSSDLTTIANQGNIALTYLDNASAYTGTIQTEAKALNKGKGFKINGVHLLADNQSTGTTTLETSGDDYATWVTRGTFDMTATKKQIRRCGFYKNSCAFRVTHSAETAWRGAGLVVDWEPAVT